MGSRKIKSSGVILAANPGAFSQLAPALSRWGRCPFRDSKIAAIPMGPLPFPGSKIAAIPMGPLPFPRQQVAASRWVRCPSRRDGKVAAIPMGPMPFPKAASSG